jgi:uncharacterized protein (TIGR02266 family)
MEPETGERRSGSRTAVELWVDERTADALYFQRATDLSTGGVFLSGTLPHPPGTRVDLALRLPGDASPLEVQGEVVARERETGMAVRFVALSLADRRRIAACLRSRAAASGARDAVQPRRV